MCFACLAKVSASPRASFSWLVRRIVLFFSALAKLCRKGCASSLRFCISRARSLSFNRLCARAVAPERMDSRNTVIAAKPKHLSHHVAPPPTPRSRAYDTGGTRRTHAPLQQFRYMAVTSRSSRLRSLAGGEQTARIQSRASRGRQSSMQQRRPHHPRSGTGHRRSRHRSGHTCRRSPATR